MFGDLFSSKRVWTMVITTALHLLAKKFGWELGDAATQAIVDNLILAAGAAFLVVTKILDVRKANKTKTA